MQLYVRSAACFPMPWDRTNAIVPGAELLNKGAARRMPTQMRKAVSCSLQALADAQCEKPDGIFIGTGLGQVDDTIGFLNEIEANAGGILSPTGFMRSTHNTVGGTIALLLTADGPNITYSHGMSSFHWALLNAALQSEEHPDHLLLVGAADEHAPLLDAMAQAAGASERAPLAAGAAFVVVTGKPRDGESARVTGLWTGMRQGNSPWWKQEELTAGPIDLVLFGTDPFTGTRPVMPAATTSVDYRNFTGTHGSAPAQAVCYGLHCIQQQCLPDGPPAAIARVLVVDRHGMETSAVLLER